MCEVLNDSELTIKDANYKEITLYIALNKTQNEINDLGLKDICPSRKHNRGPRPNITGSGIKPKEEERYGPWIFKDISNINEEKKRHLIICYYGIQRIILLEYAVGMLV